MAFRTIAIPTSVAQSVRATLSSPDYGHPAQIELAGGYGPCRHCLETFRINQENRILFTYDPFRGREPLPLPGPVYIHERECDQHPIDGGFPEGLRTHPLTLNAYARGRRLHAQSYVDDGDIESAVERLLTRPEIDYIHVRDSEAGCYDLCIEREFSC